MRSTRMSESKAFMFTIVLQNFFFQVIKIVRAIRNGWIKPKQSSDGKPKYYLLWGKDDIVSASIKL